MLDTETGGALAPADARAYAKREGLAYVEGTALLAAFQD
jgi:3,4-dihydroxy 2-butanone 4-phosphate synthase